MSAATTLLTFEDFERLPDRPGKTELLRGELIELPPPKLTHSHTGKRIFRSLDAHTNIGTVEIETGYRVTRNPDSWLIPDVSIAYPDQLIVNDYYEGSPMIAIEIISPSNRADQVQAKIREYLANGSKEVWVFYPTIKGVWIHRADGAFEVKKTLESPLVPGFQLDLDEIFA